MLTTPTTPSYSSTCPSWEHDTSPFFVLYHRLRWEWHASHLTLANEGPNAFYAIFRRDILPAAVSKMHKIWHWSTLSLTFVHLYRQVYNFYKNKIQLLNSLYPLIIFSQALIAKYENISFKYIKFSIDWCFHIFPKMSVQRFQGV